MIYPANATSDELAKLSRTNQEFCKENGIPARGVWEGPGHHEHIALGIEHAPEIEQKWLKRLAKRWLAVFGAKMKPDAFYWNPAIEPDKIASYLSKTWSKGRVMAKADYPWMTFRVSWESGFRRLTGGPSTHRKGACKPREKSGSFEVETSTPAQSPPVSPSYTVSPSQTSEKERETQQESHGPILDTQRRECPVCWRRWGRSLWAGSCMCNLTVTSC